MGVTVEDREDRTGSGAGRQGRARLERDGEAEDDDGHRDADLDAGQRLARHAPEPGQHHHTDEGERIGEACAAAGEPGQRPTATMART